MTRALVAELRRRGRQRGTGPVRARAVVPGPGADPFAALPTAELVRQVREQQRAIYGTDDRRDLYEVRDRRLLRIANAVAAVVKARDLIQRGGQHHLRTTSYEEDFELCAREPFAKQPLGCECTAFLVAPDVVATAGHCVTQRSLGNIRFVFGFRMLDRTRARTVFDHDDVYAGAKLLGRRETDTGADWALVQLDRPVRGRRPLRVRTRGKIADGTPLFVVGHPNGLPAKLAGGARVRSNSRTSVFLANLDTYGGNSGSPVLDERRHVVEGILVRGETDFVRDGDCKVSLVCPNDRCQGEAVTRSPVWAGNIAKRR